MAESSATNVNKNNELLVATFLLSSSSSSDDEELCEIMHKKPRPKIQNYIESVVHNFNDEEFRKNFRMRRPTAYKIIGDFQSSKHCPIDTSHGGRNPIPAEAHLLAFLWFAANKSSIRDVSQRFGMTESSFFRVMARVMDFLIDIAPGIIKMPNEDEKESFSDEFQKVSGFPGVVGCIDGTSINIRTPAHKLKSTYTNRHDIPSITLQGICDYKKRFIDVFTGVPGKVHDARVLRLSPISERLPSYCGNKYHILGDGAYSIRTWLLTPYKEYSRDKLTDSQAKFNRTFCATRVLIENTFGILKGRFRQLTMLDILTVEKITKFIISCCVLHNLCIDAEDFLDHDDAIPPAADSNDGNEREVEWRLRKEGEEKRKAIENMLKFL